jgi:NAD(P)-dependent dehydrogenase (short-subunit alcohol dehydrogenase family)
MALPTRTVTVRGWEMQLATNFLGHFALAAALHAPLCEAGAARIVVVSSGAHRMAAFDFDDPHFEQRAYEPWAAYGQSKSAEILFTVGGARRWADDGITVNALNPGYILTNLQRHLDDDTMRAFGVMDGEGNLTPLPHYKTPAQGAATSVLLAASPLLDGVTGRYFEDNQEARVVSDDDDQPGGVATHALDPQAADRLWEYATDAIR